MKPTAVVTDVYVCPNADGKYRATIISDERLSQGGELYLAAALNSAPISEPVAIVELNSSGQIRVVWENGTDVSNYVNQRFYTAPPHLAAAIAAAREQDARFCEGNDMSWADDVWNEAVKDCAKKIRAQQDPDGLAALRELMLTLAKEVDYCSGQDLEKLVDRVLKGE